MPDLNEAQQQFLREGHLAVVTTLRADGSPHSTVVWVDCDDGEVVFNTARERAKERHLQADPRLSLVTVDGADFHRWLVVDGSARFVDEGADDHIDALAVRYMGAGAPRISGSAEQRVIVRVLAERVEHEGPRRPDQKIDMIDFRLRRLARGAITA